MTAAPLPFALLFSQRVAAILSTLAALVARRLLRHPTLAPLIGPLWGYLNRTARRVERLLSNPAAPRPNRSAPHRPGPSGPRPTVRLPTSRGWLVRVLGPEAAACASQLQALLADPQAKALLAQAPTAQRHLNPIVRLLTPAERTVAAHPPARRPAPAPRSGAPWTLLRTPEEFA